MELKTIYVSPQLPEKEDMKQGVIYVCHIHKIANHLCVCGCGEEVVTPFQHIIGNKIIGWNFSEDNAKITLRPSIGNTFACRSHYYITNNVIKLL